MNGIKMITTLLLIISIAFLSGCGIIDKLSSDTEKTKSENSTEYIVKNQNKLCTETAEKVFDSLKDHDTEALMSMFCQKVKNKSNFEQELAKMYDFFDGEIVSYQWISDPETGELTSNGEVERLNGNPYLKTVKTSTGHEYDICVQIVLIYKDTEWEGVTQLGIHDKQTDGYLRVGIAFDY